MKHWSQLVVIGGLIIVLAVACSWLWHDVQFVK